MFLLQMLLAYRHAKVKVQKQVEIMGLPRAQVHLVAYVHTKPDLQNASWVKVDCQSA